MEELKGINGQTTTKLSDISALVLYVYPRRFLWVLLSWEFCVAGFIIFLTWLSRDRLCVPFWVAVRKALTAPIFVHVMLICAGLYLVYYFVLAMVVVVRYMRNPPGMRNVTYFVDKQAVRLTDESGHISAFPWASVKKRVIFRDMLILRTRRVGGFFILPLRAFLEEDKDTLLIWAGLRKL